MEENTKKEYLDELTDQFSYIISDVLPGITKEDRNQVLERLVNATEEINHQLII